VRYCDDFVMGFQFEADTRRMLVDLKERLAQFKLALYDTSLAPEAEKLHRASDCFAVPRIANSRCAAGQPASAHCHGLSARGFGPVFQAKT